MRPRPYYFPTELPDLHLTEEEQRENYGLPKARVSEPLCEEIKVFKAWCAVPINTARTPDYATPNSTATLVKIGKSVRAFLGFSATTFGVPDSRLSLREYADPVRLMHFVAYLKARHSKGGHILNHLSLARKVNVYLGAKAGLADTTAQAHAVEVDRWLTTLIHQVHLTEPRTQTKSVPEAPVLWRWVDRLTTDALVGVENDIRSMGSLTLDTALRIQDAAVASLVTGRDIPPCRLDFIKHLVHPRHNEVARCRDPDCRDRQNCPGNHVELQPRPHKVGETHIPFR